jgi:hypothetical protein
VRAWVFSPITPLLVGNQFTRDLVATAASIASAEATGVIQISAELAAGSAPQTMLTRFAACKP